MYTKKFHHGDYTLLETSEFKVDFKMQIKRMIEFTKYAEIDCGGENEVKDVRRQIIELESDRF